MLNWTGGYTGGLHVVSDSVVHEHLNVAIDGRSLSVFFLICQNDRQSVNDREYSVNVPAP